ELGFLFFLCLMVQPDFTTSVFSSATHPLFILLLMALVFVLSRKRRALYKPLLAGVLAGLLVLTRFDFLAASIGIGLLVPVIYWKTPFRAMALYYISGALMLAPWIIYSLHTFDVLMVSDNARTVASAYPVFVRDYITQILPTIWDAP